MSAVYNRDNRSKVEKDEAEAQKEEEAAREKHENAEREYRRQLLLQRRATGADAGPSAPSSRVAALEASPMQAATQQAVVPAAQQHVQHVNFWSEDEARMRAEHPDVAVGALDECAMRALGQSPRHAQHVTDEMRARALARLRRLRRRMRPASAARQTSTRPTPSLTSVSS